MTAELSERFKRALQDLKEVVQNGGLVQDDTPKKTMDTILALRNKVMNIGLEEDKLSPEEVKEYIRSALESTAQTGKIEKQQTIFDMISIITMHLKHVKINEELHEASFKVDDEEKLKSDPVFPHNKAPNNLIYGIIHDKYFQCTEQERRTIARSDAEFCMMIRNAITVLSGFGDNEQEAFGNTLNLEIPRSPRGNELLWDPRGDPLPETPEVFHEVIEELDYLKGIILAELSKLYPEQHKKVMEVFAKHKGQATLRLNTSHEEIRALPSLYHHCKEIDDFTEFDNIVLPLIIDALIIQRLTERNCFVNRHKRESIRKNLLAKVNERLEDG